MIGIKKKTFFNTSYSNTFGTLDKQCKILNDANGFANVKTLFYYRKTICCLPVLFSIFFLNSHLTVIRIQFFWGNNTDTQKKSVLCTLFQFTSI